MKEEKIIQSLKRFKQLKPDEGRSRQSLALILREEQEKASLWMGVSVLRNGALVLGVALFLVFGGVATFQALNGSSSAVIASFDDALLEQEMQSADFQIELKKAYYFNQSAERVATALDEVTAPKTVND